MSAAAQPKSTASTLFPDLAPIQSQVAQALAEGATISAAAGAAGIHRSTIHNWFKECKPFRAAVEESRRQSMEQHRDEMQELFNLAIKTLKEIMLDVKAPPSVRLRAALAIITRPGWRIPCEVKQQLKLNIAKQFHSLEKGLPHPLFAGMVRVT